IGVKLSQIKDIFTCSLFFLKDIFVPLPVPKRENTGKNIFSFFLKKDADSAERFSKSFWFGLFLIFLGFLGMVPSQRFFSLYVEEYLHLQSYAGLWALSAMAEIPLMFLSGKFIRKFGIPKLIIFVLLTISIRNLTYIAIPTFTGAVIAQLMHAFNFGLFHPVAVLFCVIHAPKKAASLGMTLYSVSAVGLAYIIGSIFGGYIIQFFGYPALFGVFSLFPFIGIVLALTSNLLT
ncbi:hypothetical protein HMPREF9554_00647, partial [Treponema phagedenis F0421]|uniref:MFS transporter n=1 Tax=Treponema phagedenis TaxID=162 RepID=UPI0001F63AB5